jgi:hypothetical protein
MARVVSGISCKRKREALLAHLHIHVHNKFNILKHNLLKRNALHVNKIEEISPATNATFQIKTTEGSTYNYLSVGKFHVTASPIFGLSTRWM